MTTAGQQMQIEWVGKHCHRADPITSIQAAERAYEGGKCEWIRGQIRQALRTRPGQTVSELAHSIYGPNATRDNIEDVAKRTSDLSVAGEIYGEPKTCPHKGSECNGWYLK